MILNLPLILLLSQISFFYLNHSFFLLNHSIFNMLYLYFISIGMILSCIYLIIILILRIYSLKYCLMRFYAHFSLFFYLREPAFRVHDNMMNFQNCILNNHHKSQLILSYYYLYFKLDFVYDHIILSSSSILKFYQRVISL